MTAASCGARRRDSASAMGYAGRNDGIEGLAMADHHESEHEHGSMEIREHQKTFDGFVRLSTWVCIIAAGVLVFMALANA